jgi:ribosomal protein L13
MIPVSPAEEPETFDERVRQPGLSVIAELVGEPARIRRSGRKRRVVAQSREDLQPRHFLPLWRKATEDLLRSYGDICAYACVYIHPITGSSTVDHWVPKSKAWNQVYEWTNYRLACSFMNASKSDFSDVIDPFAVEDGLFALDLIAMQVIPGPKAGSRREAVLATIRRLKLDGARYAQELDGYYEAFVNGEILFVSISQSARRFLPANSSAKKENETDDSGSSTKRPGSALRSLTRGSFLAYHTGVVSVVEDRVNQKTYSRKSSETKHDWYIIDAAGLRVGALAVRVAWLLSGKHKPTWTPHIDDGDFVIVINAALVEFSGRKWDQKRYYRHSGYPGGLRSETAREALKKHPERILERAVRGMLPTNRTRDVRLGRLKVFAGSEHPHEAQRPTVRGVKF